MIKELSLRILPEEASNEASLRRVVCRETGEKPEIIRAVRVLFVLERYALAKSRKIP